jgi:hypothetical protein
MYVHVNYYFYQLKIKALSFKLSLGLHYINVVHYVLLTLKILVVDVLEWCTSLLRYIINCSLYHMGANLFFQDALGLSMEIPL